MGCGGDHDCNVKSDGSGGYCTFEVEGVGDWMWQI